jgi:hypothetical protein
MEDITNKDNKQIDDKTSLRLKSGVNAWSINPQIIKPASTLTGAQAAEISEL